jgi:hypothetical protein
MAPGKIALIIVLAVVLLAVIGVGGFLALRPGGFLAGGTKEPNRSDVPNAASPSYSASPTARPVAMDGLVNTLKDAGLECYDLLTTPVPVKSCYRTESDGAATSVRLVGASGGEVVLAEVEVEKVRGARPGSAERGDPVPPLRELVPVVGPPLLGQAIQEGLLEESEEVNQVETAWGTGEWRISPEGPFASFEKAGTFATPPKAGFGKDAVDMEKPMAALGYNCDTSSCTKGSLTNGNDTYTSVDFGSDVVLRVENTGKPVTDDLIRARAKDALTQVLAGPDLDAAIAWIDGHLTPEYGFVQGDAGGVNLQLTREDEAGAKLEINPPGELL